MSVSKKEKVLHYANVTLCVIGIVISFYIIGWVKADNNGLVGTIGFFVCLVGLVWSNFKFDLKEKDGD